MRITKSLPGLLVIASLVVVSSWAPMPAQADLACHSGGVVATSTNGAITVVSSAYGCRSFPSASFRVEGGTRPYALRTLPGYAHLLVSDTGRTLVLVQDDHPRADRASVQLFRDGHTHGEYSLRELLGTEHTAVATGRYVEVSIDGVELVITDVDGTELLRRHLGRFPGR